MMFLVVFCTAASSYAMEPVAAVRLLQQATFGPTQEQITKLEKMSEEAWIDEQLSKPATLHRSYYDAAFEYPRANFRRNQGWLKAALHAEDQLRQRMAFALSQIFVVSQVGTSLERYQAGLVNYYDTLIDGALGNYRDLMYKVTMHPVMGTYLTYSPNYKANPEGSNEADENYAREMLQLMSLGTYLLNQDGSYQVDERGKPIETYSQAQIKGFAKVFTGLCYSGRCDWRFGDYTKPMAMSYNAHDLTEKQLLSVTLPANPKSVEEDIQAALDDVFAHSNIAPFVSQRLIQMLVTSNPTPGYIARVAAVFNDNGNNVKGDLAAVAKAILLDDEARNGHMGENALEFGKLREPLIMMTHFFRALDMYQNTDTPESGFYKLENDLYQAPMMASSVFNFYHFDYSNPRLLQAGLVDESEAIDEPQNTDTRIISLESANYPGHFVQHVESKVRISAIEPEEVTAQWKVVEGLAGEGTFSLESVDVPGNFLRHRKGNILLQPFEDKQLYREDASWFWKDGFVDPNAISLESLNYSDEYIRHRNYFLDRTVINSELDKNDATFFVKDLVSTTTGTNNPSSNKPNLVFPVFELSPEDKLLSRFNFIHRHVVGGSAAMRAYDKWAEIINEGQTREEGINNLIDYIDLMFTQGEMSDALREQILYIINMVRQNDTNLNGTLKNQHNDSNALNAVMMLLFTSPDFAIQR
ncbi:DUF1800 family protein [Colwellia sp. RE-S-Sl-9]